MLVNLHVKNLAIIDEVDIDFSNGLNILTGETGAGKSIIIGSINLALGSKVSKDIIRDKAAFALVELVFSYSDNSIRKFLEDAQIECEDNEIIISRKITQSRSISKVNGETVTLSFVQELASMLIDIHGQHDNKMLINPLEHISILDSFIKDEAKDVMDSILKEYKKYNNLKCELSNLDMDSDKRLREISLLEYEINEIESAALKEGEDKELDEQYKVMSNMENITSTLNRVSSYLEGECEDAMSRAAREVGAVMGICDQLSSIGDSLSQIEGMLSDTIRDINDYISDNEFNQEEFDELEKRVDLINMFKAKYGQTIKEINEYLDNNKKRLEVLTNYDEHIQDVNIEFEQIKHKLNILCEKLSAIRKKKALELSKMIVDALKDLNFSDADFSINFAKKKDFGPSGYDSVEFMIKSNAGEALKPLSKIASGGELSRVMLAIKSVVADTLESSSFIFDEIDTGISGRTAQMVAQKLAHLSCDHQIICITHLAQIAAMADSHYVIEKTTKDNHTSTQIRKLEDDEITLELARILGGTKITDSVMESAREMKELASTYKKQ